MMNARQNLKVKKMVDMEFSIIRNNKEIKLTKEEIDDFQQKYEKYKIENIGIKWLAELIEKNNLFSIFRFLLSNMDAMQELGRLINNSNYSFKFNIYVLLVYWLLEEYKDVFNAKIHIYKLFFMPDSLIITNKKIENFNEMFNILHKNLKFNLKELENRELTSYKEIDIEKISASELIECDYKIKLIISNKNTGRKLNTKENNQQIAYISNYLAHCYQQNTTNYNKIGNKKIKKKKYKKIKKEK